MASEHASNVYLLKRMLWRWLLYSLCLCGPAALGVVPLEFTYEYSVGCWLLACSADDWIRAHEGRTHKIQNNAPEPLSHTTDRKRGSSSLGMTGTYRQTSKRRTIFTDFRSILIPVLKDLGRDVC